MPWYFYGSNGGIINRVLRDNTPVGGIVLTTASATGATAPIRAASAPDSYLFCNGAAVSRTTYSLLFSLIGTTFGAGDGFSTFNLPTLLDVFPLSAGTTYTGLSTGGSTTVPHTIANHTHSGTSHYHALGNTFYDHTHLNFHKHIIPGHSHNAAGSTTASAGSDTIQTGSPATIGAPVHTHPLTGTFGAVGDIESGFNSQQTSGGASGPAGFTDWASFTGSTPGAISTTDTPSHVPVNIEQNAIIKYR